MSVLIIGSVAFDAIETPFGKTGKIVGGSASYIALAISKQYKYSTPPTTVYTLVKL